MAAAQAEVLILRTRARQSDEKSDHLLEAVASLKTEAKTLATNLAALKGGAALTAASDILPQAGPSKETMIGAAAVPSSNERKLDAEPLTSADDGAVRVAKQRAGENQAAPRTAKRDGSAKLMLARGDEYMSRGDIASMRTVWPRNLKRRKKPPPNRAPRGPRHRTASSRWSPAWPRLKQKFLT